ncbi:MAG: hypothetical protein AB1635_04085 [Acidobacteriota bacterium]
MQRHSPFARLVATGCVFLVGTLLLPAGLAAEPAPKTSSMRDAVKVVAERHATSLTTSRSTLQASEPDLQSGSFFKTPAGVAVLVAFGVGVGYALYSASNDRIRSSGR